MLRAELEGRSSAAARQQQHDDRVGKAAAHISASQAAAWPGPAAAPVEGERPVGGAAAAGASSYDAASSYLDLRLKEGTWR